MNSIINDLGRVVISGVLIGPPVGICIYEVIKKIINYWRSK